MTSVRRIGSNKRRNDEFVLQSSIVQYLERFGNPDVKWCAPNTAPKLSKAAAGKSKAMGAAKGWPDLMFIFPDLALGFMELKSLTGKITDEQAEFIAWCDARKIPCPVVSDIDNALMILKHWNVLIKNFQVAA